MSFFARFTNESGVPNDPPKEDYNRVSAREQQSFQQKGLDSTSLQPSYFNKFTHPTPEIKMNSIDVPEEKGVDVARRNLGVIAGTPAVLGAIPASILSPFGAAEARQEFEDLEERLPRLKEMFPNAPWENFKGLDKDKYEQAIQGAMQSTTPEGVRGIVENITGLPVSAKTDLQKLLAFGSELATFTPGKAAQKIGSGLFGMGFKSLLQDMGLGEKSSDIVAALFSNLPFGLSEILLNSFSNSRKAAKSTQKSIPVVKPSEPPGGAGVPPGGGSKSISAETPTSPFKGLVPENEIVEAVQPILEKELQSRLSPFEVRPIEPLQSPTLGKPFSHNEVQLQEQVGDIVSKVRFPNMTLASKSLRNEVNHLASKEYSNVRSLYEKSRELNKNIHSIHPELSSNLESLVSELSQAAEPSAVQKDIINISKKLISKTGTQQSGYKQLSNAELIAQIESNNQKINHDYLQGRPSNAYKRLNEILSNAIESSSSSNPEAFESWNNARKAYANWSKKYGSNEILPWRDPSNRAHTKLLKGVENADQLKVLEDTVGDSKKGKAILDSIKRDFVERKLSPFIKDPKKMDSIEYNDVMRELQPILSLEERLSIDETLDKVRQSYLKQEKDVELFKQAVADHKKSIKFQQEQTSKLREQYNATSKDFPYTNNKALLSDMKSILGLKRIEKHLPQNAQGKEAMQKIKDYASARLLTNGKIGIEDTTESLYKILGDVDKRALLEYTLGKETADDLYKIIRNYKNIDSNLPKVSESLKAVKNVGKLIPGIKGSIASVEAIVDLWRMLRPAVVKGDYSFISDKLLYEIIYDPQVRKIFLEAAETSAL